MIAYVFPGQGSQVPGMGRQLAAESAIAAEVFRVVDGALGFALSETMFTGDADALLPTEVQQPAIFAHSIAAFAALRKRHTSGPQMVAGHSLGEYSALVAAGCLGLEEAAKLVRLRGQLMADAAREVGGTMAAIVGMAPEAVADVVQEAATSGTVVIANYNGPGQVVISGKAEAVAAAGELARERGGRAIPLKVSGAFHSPLMASAAQKLRPHLQAAAILDAEVPLVSNVDATPRRDAEEIRRALIAQVTSSVRWEESVRRMVAEGVDTFVELGPGNVLAKLILRIDGQVKVYSVGTMADVGEFLEQATP